MTSFRQAYAREYCREQATCDIQGPRPWLVLKTWTYRQDSRQAESPPEADGLRGRRPRLVLLNRVLLPGVHLHLLVLVAHQRLVAVGVRLHGAERGLRQAQAWKNPRTFKHRWEQQQTRRRPATPRFYLPTSFGETSRPKKTTTPPANCTTDVTRKAYCTRPHKVCQRI